MEYLRKNFKLEDERIPTEALPGFVSMDNPPVKNPRGSPVLIPSMPGTFMFDVAKEEKRVAYVLWQNRQSQRLVVHCDSNNEKWHGEPKGPHTHAQILDTSTRSFLVQAELRLSQMPGTTSFLIMNWATGTVGSIIRHWGSSA